MKVKIGKRYVDVLRRDCGERPCYALGFDKGVYVQGRGYTSYHKVAKPVCWTRHMQGCPDNSVCEECRTVSVLDPGGACDQVAYSIEARRNVKCEGHLIEREGVK